MVLKSLDLTLFPFTSPNWISEIQLFYYKTSKLSYSVLNFFFFHSSNIHPPGEMNLLFFYIYFIHTRPHDFTLLIPDDDSL